MAWRQFLVAVVVVVVAVVAAQDPVFPDIWKAVEGSYDSYVVVNFPDLDTPTSMLVDELYDIVDEQGSLTITDHGKTTTTTYYSKSSQAFVVEGNLCSTGGLLDHPGYHLWGWHYVSEDPDGKNNFLYGPSALLRIPRDYAKDVEYRGIEEVRGILANHWVLQTRDEYTIDYLFALEDWTMPFGHELDGVNLQAPLQVKVHGKQGNPWEQVDPWGREDKDMSVYYDFITFQPRVDPARWRGFLVDGGLACEGRVTLDPELLTPPTPPTKFQVFVEVVDRGQQEGIGSVFRTWLYYDANSQLLRVDVNPDNDLTQSHKSFKSIHDYNTGIHYNIDLATGGCEMAVLDPDEFGNMIGGSSIISDVIMADPAHLFHLDDKYIFSGYEETRGVRTSRWSAVRDDIRNPETGAFFKMAVVDYQFSVLSTVDIGEQKGRPFPIRLDVTVYRDDNTSVVLRHVTVNLLHMLTSFEAFNPFDVRECMGVPSMRTWLKITYKGLWDEGARQKPDEFKKILMNQLTGGTDASPVRFPEIQLEHNEEFIFATVLMLEPAPYHLQFKQLPDRKPSPDHDTQVTTAINDVDLCASTCLTYNMFRCKSFYICEGLGRNCIVSNFVNSTGKPWHVNKDCRHYKKAAVENTEFQRPNWEIQDWVATEIGEGRMHIQLEFEDEAGEPHTYMYEALDSHEELLGDDPILVDIVRSDFRVAFKQGRLKDKYTDQQLPQISFAMCARTCQREKGFPCESVSYCYSSRRCYLSSHLVNTPVGQNDLVFQQDCVVAGRRHTDDYEWTDGLVYMGPSDAIIKSVDPDNCAFKCSNISSFTCRSFDYCAKDSMCYLYEVRTMDMDGALMNHTVPGCTHFTRNALVDFAKHDHQVLEGSRDRYFKFTSTSYCAEMCEQEPDYSCNGFDYCQTAEDITCFLTSDHYSDEGVEITDSPTCDHYSREFYDGKDRSQFAHTRSSKYIYSPGDMAGLACSMLIISIAGTFAGIYAYNKYFKG